MEAFFSWFTSQSGVSLLVALIALGGVLINNRAAEKRRDSDQQAADKRRKDDQAAEDARRKADDDRRERERSEDRKLSVSKLEAEQKFQDKKWSKQLVVQEKARQRQAVSDFFREIREAESKLDSFSREIILSSTTFDSFNERDFKLRRAFKKEDFYEDILAAVQRLEMEITQKEVSLAVANLTKILGKELSEFTNMRDNDFEKWLEQCGNFVALGEPLQRAMNSLRSAARNHLHPIHLIDADDSDN